MATDYETLLRIAKERRSIRQFRDDPIPESTMEQLLEIARWAPSASNRQAFRYVLIQSKNVISQMKGLVELAIGKIEAALRADSREDAQTYLGHFTHFASAPLVIVPIHRGGVNFLHACSEVPNAIDADQQRAESDSLSSVAASIMSLLLAAHTLGLGACWMTGPLIAQQQLRKLLQLQPGWSISALIPVGFPAEQPKPSPRRPLMKMVQRFE